MSQLIGSAAFFQVCACGEHGRIVLAGGERGSENLCSKDNALRLMDLAVEQGRVTKDEVPGLRQQIEDSPLPWHEDDAESKIRIGVGIKNLWEALVSEDDDDQGRHATAVH